MSHIPVARGLVICDQVIVEERTRNVTLVNCFSMKRSLVFPTDQIKFSVVAFLSDGQGEIQFEVVIQHLDTLDVIFRRRQRLVINDRMQEVRFIYRIETCEFPELGAHQVSLFADGELLAHQRFRIAKLEDTE